MKSPSEQTEKSIKKQKETLGFTYGAAAGLAFAVALWGYDWSLLANSHALFPWIKFILGAPLSMLACGLAGWLTSHFGKPLPGILFWAMTAGLLAWFTSLVPLILAPAITGLLKPEIQPLLQCTPSANLWAKIGVAFFWIIIPSFILAIVQIPLIMPAVFSVSSFGKVAPHLIGVFLMLLGGTVVDSLNNDPLRAPIYGLDKTIQFALDTRGQEVDPLESRKMHLASLRKVEDIVHESRQLVVGRCDPLLENVDVLVNFNGNWAECSTFFGQTISCKPISP